MERPLDPAHNEDAWQRTEEIISLLNNRCVEITIDQLP